MSTGVALIAFLGAAVLAAYRHYLKSREGLIRSLPVARRSDALTRELNAFGINAEGLTKEQRFTLALKEIELRRTRLFSYLIVATTLAIVAGAVAGGSIVSTMSKAATDAHTTTDTEHLDPSDLNAATLKMISDTADRICGVVISERNSNSIRVDPRVTVKLNELLGKLSVSGSAEGVADAQAGTLQRDLPTAINGQNDCKFKVFGILTQKLLSK